MIEISSELAFWILAAWRRMNAQLHVSGTIGGKSESLPGVMWWLSPKESKMCIELLEPSGQKREWKVSLDGATYSFNPSECPAMFPAGREIWISFLKMDWPDGGTLLLGERTFKEGLLMIDPETRAVLQATLELLKTQMTYVRNLHDAFGALYDSMVQVYPELEGSHRREMEKIRENPWQQSQLDAIDVLLRELANPRE